MADNFVKLGHECTIVTSSELRESDRSDTYAYQVIRNPSLSQKIAEVKKADIVYSNGASVNLFWLAFLLGKPFVWTHQGYQLSSIDGLGWVDGQASPLQPSASFRFHLKNSGLLYALAGYLKLMHRRLVGHLVSKNVAVTSWVAYRQSLPNQVVLHTPYRTSTFSSISESTSYTYDFFFVGRLVSEKGVTTLLRAFECMLRNHSSYQGNLLLIGDGVWKENLQTTATELQIKERVDFVGRKTGNELLEWVAKGKIAVIPSEWQEPMGGVALEMIAAGKPTIVSKEGGMAECIGTAGLVFQNGDYQSLSDIMWQLLQDPQLQSALRSNAKEQLIKMDEVVLTKKYVELFEQIIH